LIHGKTPDHNRFIDWEKGVQDGHKTGKYMPEAPMGVSHMGKTRKKPLVRGGTVERDILVFSKEKNNLKIPRKETERCLVRKNQDDTGVQAPDRKRQVGGERKGKRVWPGKMEKVKAEGRQSG